MSGHAHGGEGIGAGLRPRLVSGYSGVVTPVPPAADHGQGPVMTDAAYQKQVDALAAHPLLRDENVRVPERSADGVSRAMLVLGLVGLAFTVLGVFALGLKHAMASYLVGVASVLAACLGSMFLVMVFHMVNAHWSVTLRRQLENVMSLTWVPVLLLLPFLVIETVSQGTLLTWLDPALASLHLIEHKAGYLNPVGLWMRYLVYAVVWSFLSLSLYKLSREQDVNGDRNLTRRMRRLSGVGLLLFALTVPFAAFDYLMSMDYRFFSTMWPVYYFAGAITSAAALCALVTAVLRTFGRLTGVVTKEHFHDLGKLMFAFNVFWGYIAFSQYFLIWYSNIPEETAYFLHRTTGAWKPLYIALIVGHFIVPFFILISRKTKKNTLGLGIMAAYLLVVQVIDMVFVVRPMVYVGEAAANAPGLVGWLLDAAAVVGVVCLFGGLLVARIGAGPLTALRDPRLAKALAHRNYV